MLELIDIAKKFQDQWVLHPMSARIPAGSIACLLGPSGSGKSTLLRCLARLTSIDHGKMLWHQFPLSMIAQHDIGMVFQGLHLFPHQTVLQNLIYAPVTLGTLQKHVALETARQYLSEFTLSSKESYYPHQLSGGQKQRVAIARTLMLDPKIILFDEPTSALDPELVLEVAQLIQRLKQPHRLIVVATHDLRVCQLIADHIIFLDAGHMVENTDAQTFFSGPQSERAQRFIQNISGHLPTSSASE